MFVGGDTPVFTTSSNLWVFQIGEALHTRHMAALMGLDLSMVTFSVHMSESRFRQRLGMAVHIPNFGLVLLAALTPPLRACLGEVVECAIPRCSGEVAGLKGQSRRARCTLLG